MLVIFDKTDVKRLKGRILNVFLEPNIEISKLKCFQFW